MPRLSYKKWRSVQDFGIRPGLVLPAWNPGDLVEVIGTGIRGQVVRSVTLDFTRWEIMVPNGPGKSKYLESHANNLRKVLA